VKLPNFISDPQFNELRRQMGATTLGDLTLERRANRLTIAELEKLVTGGIDLQSLDEVRVLGDGTLAYKDRRVLLYIRDVSNYGRRGAGTADLPKFHVSNCKTLHEMLAKRRFNRYVVATRDDGKFQINLMQDRAPVRTSIEELRVCQYCLGEIQYENFSHDLSSPARQKIVSAFTVKRFFEIWPVALIDGTGLDSDATAPLNDYGGNFGLHSAAAKERARYKCTECARDLSPTHLRQYLHAHHENGLKYDDRAENLRVLCIRCHSEQPDHGHMRSLPQYKAFLRHVA
jgi:hypothetical protein